MKCRICLKLCQPEELYSLFFTINSDGITLDDILCRLTNIVAKQEDGLPQNVCTACSSDLLYVSDFKLKCQTSNAQLLNEQRQQTNQEMANVHIKKTQNQNNGADKICQPIKLKVETDSDEEHDYLNDSHEAVVVPNNIINYAAKTMASSVRTEITPKQNGILKKPNDVHNREKLSNDHRGMNVTMPPRYGQITAKQNGIVEKPNKVQKHEKLSNGRRGMNVTLPSRCSEITPKQNAIVVKPNEVHKNEKLSNVQGDMNATMPPRYGETLAAWHKKTGHYPKGEYKCDSCEKVFPYFSQLRLHNVKHLNYRPLECIECGKTFKQKTNLQVHMERHKKKNSFPCSQCNKSFLTRSQLTTHTAVHYNSNIQNGNSINPTTVTSALSLRDIENRTNVALYPCESCNESFSSSSLLSKHFCSYGEQVKGALEYCNNLLENKKSFECQLCDKRFFSQSAFLRHKTSH